MMKYILILILLCVACMSAYSQGKQITREEYWQPLRTALQKGRLIDRRVTEKIENYQDDKLISTETWLYEYLLPDRTRIVNSKSENGTDRRTEQIDIGEIKYCKRDDSEWTISKSCIGGGGFGGDNPITEKYTFENVTVDGQPLKRYQRSVTRKSWKKDDERMWFSESTFWLDMDGRIVKEEKQDGIVDPFAVTRRTLETYEYEPKDLKIEAPR